MREQWDDNHENELAVRTSHVTAMFLQAGFSSQAKTLAKVTFLGKIKVRSVYITD